MCCETKGFLCSSYFHYSDDSLILDKEEILFNHLIKACPRNEFKLIWDALFVCGGEDNGVFDTL